MRPCRVVLGIAMNKYCPGCKNTKPYSEFQKHKNRPDGLQSWCKECFAKKELSYKERRKELRTTPQHKAYVKEYMEKTGKELIKKYKKSEKYKATILKYGRSVSGKESSKRYRQSENGKRSQQVRHERRRAALANAEGAFSIPEWKLVVKEYNNLCAYCNTKNENLQIDHVVPLSRGGRNSIDNIVPACGSCNSSKRDKTLIVWMYERAQL